MNLDPVTILTWAPIALAATFVIALLLIVMFPPKDKPRSPHDDEQ